MHKPPALSRPPGYLFCGKQRNQCSLFPGAVFVFFVTRSHMEECKGQWGCKPLKAPEVPVWLHSQMHHCAMFSQISLDAWVWGGLGEAACESVTVVFPVILASKLQLPCLYSFSPFAGKGGSVCLSSLPGIPTLAL